MVMVMFREIHKNTWLKRLTADGKKVTIGPKKSERSWVVFCVHDDMEALLEGYSDPRHAPSHSPEWIVSMHNTLHISHALIPNSHEFEFVVTLSNEVVRFHAMSWDIMQEWVETLRSKLREMKILSPRENLYTKLPEIKAPLLPTRDPTSPLPAPPPVPAAIVPGVERIIPPSTQAETNEHDATRSDNITDTAEGLQFNTALTNANITEGITTERSTATTVTMATTATSLFTSMSNTLTQNLLNMLSDPINAYSEQINDVNCTQSVEGVENISMSILTDIDSILAHPLGEITDYNDNSQESKTAQSLLRNTCKIKNLTVLNNKIDDSRECLANHRFSADQIQNLENILQDDECYIPRPHTSRSLSVGAADKSVLSVNKLDHFKKIVNENIRMETLISNNKGNNITELEINATDVEDLSCISLPMTTSDTNTNITIIQVSTAVENMNIHMNNEITAVGQPELPSYFPLKSTTSDIFTFASDNHELTPFSSIITNDNNSPIKLKQHEYKSNVQIIPSTKSNTNTRSDSCTTVQIMTQQLSTKQNQNLQKVTTVHVAGNEVAAAPTTTSFGNCFESISTVISGSSSSTSSHNTSTPKMSKNIILPAISSCVTNITVNNANENVIPKLDGSQEICKIMKSCNETVAVIPTEATVIEKAKNTVQLNPSGHYEKVFLSTSSFKEPRVNKEVTQKCDTSISVEAETNVLSPSHGKKISNTEVITTNTAQLDNSVNFNNAKNKSSVSKNITAENNESKSHNSSLTSQARQLQQARMGHTQLSSPVTTRRRIVSPTNAHSTANALPALHNGRPPFLLKRGNTEAAIVSRPSRRDYSFLSKVIVNKKKLNITGQYSNLISNDHQKSVHQITSSNNNNSVNIGPSTSSSPRFTKHHGPTSETLEQRKRSSSTSDAHNDQQRYVRISNNNESFSYCVNAALRSPIPPTSILDSSSNNTASISSISGGITSATNGAITTTHSPIVGKRMSLREQQIMQLRREIMHPGGVRLQLRRKDCVGSIAWVDAYGVVWVAGWKQKEHPVLYNALHIGDQLLSVAGIAINSAAEANKVIRNANTLFVEILVRRIPMGRGYAIRRDREGQCLGLIRDGNTATIVDVIPNSLAARHGLPPKAQSFDGTGLTCWMLTEINGRPLNLFFKDYEIRDRLNSVGRDISILVQPSDLMTKLKKQLKSLRGYKDYLVQ